MTAHTFDSDGICTRCGFDGAEWHWWRHDTYEGRASGAQMPPCEVPRVVTMDEWLARTPAGQEDQ